jgi:hypothetical protein
MFPTHNLLCQYLKHKVQPIQIHHIMYVLFFVDKLITCITHLFENNISYQFLDYPHLSRRFTPIYPAVPVATEFDIFAFSFSA